MLKLAVALAFAMQSGEPPSLAVQQLRHVVGEWRVTTEFLAPDGTVRAAIPGTYEFRWISQDKIVQGSSTLKDLGSAGILFFIHADGKLVEMVSVGRDGRLWHMVGPVDSETRTTPNVTMPDGSTLMLRFTRYNVQADSFESRMELSTDGGATWVKGNHQTFSRCPADGCPKP